MNSEDQHWLAMVDGAKLGFSQNNEGLIGFFVKYGPIMENIKLPQRYFGDIFCGYLYWEVTCVKIL